MEVLNLNGIWGFSTDPKDEGVTQGWMHRDNQPYLEDKSIITVPSCWNRKSCEECAEYSGKAWFWKDFRVKKTQAFTYVLHFGSIAHKATIYIDGEKVGEFSGAFFPFEINITPYIDGEKHFLAVCIDGSPKANRYPPIPNNSNYSGIFGNVTVETRDPVQLFDRHVTVNLRRDQFSQKLQYAELNIDLYFRNNGKTDYQGKLYVGILRDYVPVVEEIRDIAILHENSRLSKMALQVNVKDLELWAPDTPFVYQLNIQLRGPHSVDLELNDILGIREIQMKSHTLLLNGEDILLKGADFIIEDPEFGFNIPEIRLLEKVKDLKKRGINIIRPNRGILPSSVIKYASQIGMLVIADLPIPELTSIEKQTFFNEYIYENGFQPSLFAYGINKGVDKTAPAVNKSLLDIVNMLSIRFDPPRYFLTGPDLKIESWLENE